MKNCQKAHRLPITENSSLHYIRVIPPKRSNEWRSPSPCLSNTTQKKRRRGGEPLATLCRFDRRGNRTTDLPLRQRALNNSANRPVALNQGWANFSHERPDLPKPQAARYFLFPFPLKTSVKTKKKNVFTSFDVQCTPQNQKKVFTSLNVQFTPLNRAKTRKKVLSFCKCRWARVKEPAGQIWPAGRSLSMSALNDNKTKCDSLSHTSRHFLHLVLRIASKTGITIPLARSTL